MDLGVDRVPAVGQALDQVHLPQRAGPIQQGGVQPGGQGQQLLGAPGAGQRVPADVMTEVDVPGGVPSPLAQRGQRPAGTLAEQRRDLLVVDGGLEHLPHRPGVGALGRGEHRQPTHVHRMFAGFPQQKQ